MHTWNFPLPWGMMLAAVTCFAVLGLLLVMSFRGTRKPRTGEPFSPSRPPVSVWRLTLAASVLVSGLLFTLYVCVQQSIRTGAEDPQRALALEMADRLNQGDSAMDLLPRPHVALENSELPFALWMDASGKTIRSTASLSGKDPAIPAGSLRFALTSGQNSITWQPSTDLRFAMVIYPVHAGSIAYVAVGRSLRQVEIREQQLFYLVSLAWLAAEIWMVIMALWLSGTGIRNRTSRAA